MGGLDSSSISSNGRDTPKVTIRGNPLTKSTPHTCLKPITDQTPSKIKGRRYPQSTTSPLPSPLNQSNYLLLHVRPRLYPLLLRGRRPHLSVPDPSTRLCLPRLTGYPSPRRSQSRCQHTQGDIGRSYWDHASEPGGP
jgi:hypothetical protein